VLGAADPADIKNECIASNKFESASEKEMVRGEEFIRNHD
jgi:hypothetical protein